MKKKLYTAYLIAIILALFSTQNFGQELPLAGDLIITEFMSNPDAVSDTKGEWIELLNTSDKTLLLNDLMITDEGSNHYLIESDDPIILLPGNYFLMGRSAKSEENGGINLDHEYSNFTLGNSEDEIILYLNDTTILDQVKYNSDWQITKGTSLELNPEYFNSTFNEEAFKWNLAKVPFGNGDLGSPGYANSLASGIDKKERIDKLLVYPNPCFDVLNIKLNLNKKVPLDISLINLVGQEIMIFECDHCEEVYLQMDTNFLEKGVWIVRITYEGKTKMSKVLVF